jgi:acyl-coenzyme A thioesterase PaaI-like protein
VLEYIPEDLTADEVARLRRIYEPLTESVRELIDATIRTEVDGDAVAAARAEIDRATERLRATQIDGAFGVRTGVDGDQMPWGNAVIGVRNPVAAPLILHRAADGSVVGDFRLGAAYEGPPGHVHGGVSAMILDHVLGEGASLPGRPRLTGTITMRYRRLTPLGQLHTEARIVRVEGIKTFAEGHIADAEGITVQAEGVFITPKWLRD